MAEGSLHVVVGDEGDRAHGAAGAWGLLPPRQEARLLTWSPALWCGVSCAGAALFQLPALAYRIDRFVCTDPPGWVAAAQGSIAFLAGVALLTAGWLGLATHAAAGRLRARDVLLLGALVHVVAILSPPFLSQDPLAYVAIGRAVAVRHLSPWAPFRESLAGDPILTAMPHSWLGQGSTYGPGFNALVTALAHVGADDLVVQLRLLQLIGVAAMLGAAALVARTAGARGAALVLLCPLAVIEGSVGAHNDGLLALSVAAFAWCVSRRRPALAALALLAGLLVKASAALLLAFYLLHLVLARVRWRPRGARAWCAVGAGALLAVGLAAWMAWPALATYSSTSSRMLGSPADPSHCVRSVECLPRRILHHVLHADLAAWGLGLLFRAAALVLLVRTAARSVQAPLRWAAAFLFFYYLYLHPWSWSWYLLALLPLLPHAEARLLPAMLLLCWTAVAYYPAQLSCERAMWVTGVAGFVDGLLVILPPTALLLRLRRRGAPGSAEQGGQDEERRREAAQLP